MVQVQGIRRMTEVLPSARCDRFLDRAFGTPFRPPALRRARNVDSNKAYFNQLRLRVTKEKHLLVLDCIASKGMFGITVDHVELAVKELLGEERFIEPDA